MSNISRLTSLGAAGAGGVKPAEFGNENSSTQGLHMHTGYCVEIPNTNFIAVLGVHQTRDVYVHIIEVNGSNLTATYKDTEYLDNNYSSDIGIGFAYNPDNQSLVAMKLDTSGNFIGYQIDFNSSTGAITNLQTSSMGNWSSGYRTPHEHQNTLSHLVNEYLLQEALRSNGGREVRVIQNYGNNNWSSYSWTGVGVTGDRNTQHNIVRNTSQTGLDMPVYDMGVYNNDTYVLGRYVSTVSTNSFNDGDMVNAQPILTGSNMGIASGWDNIREKLHIYTTNGVGSSFVQYRTYDNDTGRTSGISDNPSTSGTDNTLAISGGLARASFVDGCSGNVIGFNDREKSQSALNAYQFVYNDSGHSEVSQIFSQGSRRHVMGNPGVYNAAQDCSLMCYRANTDNNNWYYRVFRGIR